MPNAWSNAAYVEFYNRSSRVTTAITINVFAMLSLYRLMFNSSTGKPGDHLRVFFFFLQYLIYGLNIYHHLNLKAIVFFVLNL